MMKFFAAILLALVSTASAFTAPVSIKSTSAVARSSDVVAFGAFGGAAPKKAKKVVKKVTPKKTGEVKLGDMGGGFFPWLMSGRPQGGQPGRAAPELELLSGATRPGAALQSELTKRFQINYDTRPRGPVAKSSKSKSINRKDASTW